MPKKHTDSQPHQQTGEQRVQHSEMAACPECESETILHHAAHAEVICAECGLVIDDDQIDHSPEWRAYTQAEREDRSRVGAPTTELLHDKGLTTTIDWRNTDAHGRTLSADRRNQVRRLRTWQNRLRTSDAGERNLKQALTELLRMASALGIPSSVQEVASTLYRQALDADLLHGRSIEGVATAALYAACRQEELPRSLDEVTAVARVDRKEVGRTYRYLVAELQLEMEPVDPRLYLPRFCSALELDEAVRQEAYRIIDVTVDQGLHSGKSPVGVAAAAVYLAARRCNQDCTQEEIAAVTRVTVVTIRNRYREQAAALADA